MLSEKLKHLRSLKDNMSQAELAEFLGVTQQAVGKWERDKTTPDYDTLKKLASFFNVTTDYLLGNDVPASGGWMPMSKSNNKDTEEALAWLDKYEQLDTREKETINSMIDIALKNREKE